MNGPVHFFHTRWRAIAPRRRLQLVRESPSSFRIISAATLLAVFVIVYAEPEGGGPSGWIAECSAQAPSQAPDRGSVAFAQRASEPPSRRRRTAQGLGETDLLAVRILLADLGPALRSAEVRNLAPLIDTDRVYTEVGRMGVLKPLSASEEQALRLLMRSSVPTTFARHGESLAYRRVEVVRSRILDDPRDALVDARHWTEENTSFRIRWRVRKQDEKWQVYDWELLHLGMRFTAAMALPYELLDRFGAEHLRDAAAAFTLAARAQQRSDFATMKTVLGRLGEMELPAALEAVRHVQLAAANTARGSFQEAVANCDAAAALREDLPVVHYLRTVAYNGLGQYERVLAEAAEFDRLAGADALLLTQMADALVALGRTDEAMQAYRRGLKDDPNSVDCLVGVGLLLGPESKSEFMPLFLQLRNASGSFEPVADAFLEQGDVEALRVLIVALGTIAEDDPRGDFYAAELMMIRGEFEPAADMLRKAIPLVNDDAQRRRFLDAYLAAMLSADKPLDAYRQSPFPQESFTTIADWLVDAGDALRLGQLIDLHRRNGSGGSSLPYYQGHIHLMRQQWQEADRSFAAGLATATDEASLSRLKYGRIYALFHGGDWRRAYREIEPRQQTFAELAFLMSEAQQVEPLEALIATRRRDDPGDALIGLWLAELKWLAADYHGVVELLTQHGEAIRASDVAGARLQLNDRLIRSLVRLGRWDDAVQAEQAVAETEKDPLHVAVIYAAQGDVRRTAAALEILLAAGYGLEVIYADADVGSALASDAMQPVRDRFADPSSAADRGP